jgi:hypothetical protein
MPSLITWTDDSGKKQWANRKHIVFQRDISRSPPDRWNVIRLKDGTWILESADLYQLSDEDDNPLDQWDYRIEAHQITEGEAIDRLREARVLRGDKDWPEGLQGRIGTRSKAKPAAERPKGGLTPNEVAKRLRVNADKVRAWIKCGKLDAINTASAKCGKPRWVVTPEALARFEASQKPEAPPIPAPRCKRQRGMVDYFPG